MGPKTTIGPMVKTFKSLNSPARIAVLVSGTGSNLSALLEAQLDPSFGATVVSVGADRDGAGALELAADAGVETFVLKVSDFPDRDAWDAALSEKLQEVAPDIVVCAGFMKMLGPQVLAAFPGRVVNTHNSLLPAFAGINGPADAVEYGVKIAGATLFVVDPGMDSGAILAQVTCPVFREDTAETLLERIKGVERAQLVDVVGKMARNGWWIDGRWAEVNPHA